MTSSTRRYFFLSAFIFAFVRPIFADPQLPVHLRDVERLLAQMDMSNTSYSYDHAREIIVWEPPEVTCHTDCSGLISLLLMHGYGYTAEALQRWLGSNQPRAKDYFDAIQSGNGFLPIRYIRDLEPGDFIAIKYLSRSKNTGHIMIVEKTPRRVGGGPPLIDGTEQWLVAVIDSSESGHWKMDTRYKRGLNGKDHDGLGRGIFRLYSDNLGRVAGYCWSTGNLSEYKRGDVAPVALGRLIPNFRP